MEKGNSSLSAMQWKFFDNAMKICVFFFFSVMQWGESSLKQKKLRELMFV